MLAQKLFAQADLDSTTAVAQGHKNQLPNVPQQHNPAGTFGLLALIAVLKSALDIFGLLSTLISATVRVNAKFFNPGQFLLPLLFKPALPF
jgi:hypothetical protein